MLFYATARIWALFVAYHTVLLRVALANLINEDTTNLIQKSGTANVKKPCSDNSPCSDSGTKATWRVPKDRKKDHKTRKKKEHKTGLIRAKGQLNKIPRFMSKHLPLDVSDMLDDDDDENEETSRGLPVSDEGLFGDKLSFKRSKQWQHFAAQLSREKRNLTDQVENLTAELHQTAVKLQEANKQLQTSSSENQRLWDSTKTASDLTQEKQNMIDMITKLSRENRRLRDTSTMKQRSVSGCEQEVQRLSRQVAKLSQEKQTLYWKIREMTG